MRNQIIALLSKTGHVSWIRKSDYLQLEDESKENFTKTAFFWDNGVESTYQAEAERVLRYDPFTKV
jgi:bisphosphoglycerate-independent phosphoglycerate mutase (AlkP superfamily)